MHRIFHRLTASSNAGASPITSNQSIQPSDIVHERPHSALNRPRTYVHASNHPLPPMPPQISTKWRHSIMRIGQKITANDFWLLLPVHYAHRFVTESALQWTACQLRSSWARGKCGPFVVVVIFHVTVQALLYFGSTAAHHGQPCRPCKRALRNLLPLCAELLASKNPYYKKSRL